MSDPHDYNVPRSGPTVTILLADDEATPRAETARLLRRGLKSHVFEAYDGRHALRVFQQHPGKIDLVLTDFIMPVMDGGELAERIRDIDPKVPIVLMSAPLTGEAAELLRGYREFPFLEKPFTFLKLCGMLAPLLKSRRYRSCRRPSGSWRNRSARGDGVDS